MQSKTTYYKKISRSILISMILVPVVSFILILGVGYYYFTTSIETSTIAGMKRIVYDHRQMIESFLMERKADLEFVLSSYSFDDMVRPNEIDKVFGDLQKGSRAFLDLGVFNKNGVHVAYYGPYKLSGKIYKSAAWFKEVMKKGFYISDVFLGYRRVPHFVIAIAKGDEEKRWVVRATIDTYMFNNLVKNVRIGKTGEAYILSAHGIFQTERRSGGNLMDVDLDKLRYPSEDKEIKTFIEKDARKDTYLYATTWMKNRDWLLVVRQQKSDAFRDLYMATYLILIITVMGGVLIVGMAFYLTGRIVRRMKKMDVEKESLGQQLIRASRLAEIGEMSTGIAHEINNPLQIMKSEQTLIKTIISDLKEKGDLKESEDVKEIEDSVDQIDLQISRCSKITQSVLKFGRKSEPDYRDMDLRVFIPEITTMVEKKSAVHGISLEEDIAEDTPLVHGDPTQLQQVLLNLFNNAIDAIVDRHGSQGGELIITAGPKEDGKVGITVKDNGSGISPENLPKIFSPFYTTKPVGKGTGLGLSVCYGIINSMGGVMEVDSEMGVGTTFLITLPSVI